VSEALARLRTAAAGLVDAGRDEGIEPGGPLGRWLAGQAEALAALAELFDGQESRLEELMAKVSAAAAVELEKLAAATALGNKVVRAGEVALREAHTAQIAMVVEKEELVAKMTKETLPLFAQRLKEVLVIRERRLNDNVKYRHWLLAGAIVLALYVLGYGTHVWESWPATSAISWCAEHPELSAGHVFCDMTAAGVAN
jgi:hypothetical protein